MLPSPQVIRRHTPTAPSYSEPTPVPAVAPPTPLASSSTTSSSLPVDELPQQCWICYDDASESTRHLLHVCDCTLLAHSDCLLTWLDQQHSTQPTTATKCPVCAAPIVVKEDTSDVLRVYRKLRRKADSASLVAAVGAVTASGWFVASAYGAWVVRVFMGEQVAQALLISQDGSVPWRHWLNLPLIPFSLVLSRTPLVDSLLPFLPLTLVLSTHTHTTLFDPLGLDDLTLHYPPSPTLTVCVLPWLRLIYLRARLRVFNAVLGRKKRYRGLAGVFEEAAADDQSVTDGRREPLELVATLEVEVDDGEAGAAGPAQPRAEGAQSDEQEQEHAPAAAAAEPGQVAAQANPDAMATSRLRVGLGRLTSLVLGALLFPALSSLAGSALFYLAARNPSLPGVRLLRRVLGVSAVLAASGRGYRPSSGGGLGAASAAVGTWVRQLVLSPATRSSAAAGGAVIDPVWVRNTLGAGVVLLVRDAAELVAGVLENRRRASRRVVEKPLRPKGAAAAEVGDTSSGGRDAGGREAVVHTLL
ncbi:hypothetical protein JCM10207_008614 [Rhodosporidiobolus poonsookiae]